MRYGVDRTSIELPSGQTELINAVAEVNQLTGLRIVEAMNFSDTVANREHGAGLGEGALAAGLDGG